VWRGVVTGVSDRGVWVEVHDLAPGSLGPRPALGGARPATGTPVVVADLAGGGSGVDLAVLGSLAPPAVGETLHIGELRITDNGRGLDLAYGDAQHGVVTTNHQTQPSDSAYALVTKSYVDALAARVAALEGSGP
jgi:hypothetical protein